MHPVGRRESRALERSDSGEQCESIVSGSYGEPASWQHGDMHTIQDTASPAHLNDDNGVLSKVPSQCVSIACKSLPDPACATVEEMQVEVDAEWMGRVRLTFKRRKYSRPRAKSSYYAWLCWHAERAE